MCVSSPLYPVIITCSNVKGGRQMLPDPDWKAEVQKGAQARTNGVNNNDDDNQGGDMPSWILWIHIKMRGFNFRVICEVEKVAKFRTSYQKCQYTL